MSLIIEIFGAVFAMFIVILIHEMGHFTMAKILGVKVLRFSIGFGKSLLSYHSKSGTEYTLSAFPLGGYVKMVERNDPEVLNLNKKIVYFDDYPVWKRILIILAGPLSNFLLAIIAFWIIFIMGFSYLKPVIGKLIPDTPAYTSGLQVGDEIVAVNNSSVIGWQDVIMSLIESVGEKNPVPIVVKRQNQTEEFRLALMNLTISKRDFDLLDSVGILPFQPSGPAIITQMEPNAPATLAGLKINDQIVSINDQPIKTWDEAQRIIRAYPNQLVSLKILRAGKSLNIKCNIGTHPKDVTSGFLGVMFKVPPIPKNMVAYTKENFLTAWKPALLQVKEIIIFNGKVFLKMLQGQISPSGLSGPVGILQIAGQASQAGIKVYLSLVALISIALGFANLLPIPVLDGGHLVLNFYELITRRQVPLSVKNVLWSFGLAFLLIIIIYSTYNDILHIFSSL